MLLFKLYAEKFMLVYWILFWNLKHEKWEFEEACLGFVNLGWIDVGDVLKMIFMVLKPKNQIVYYVL